MNVFGLREVKLTDTSGGSATFLPAALLLAFRERVTTEEFAAAGKLVAVRSFVAALEWDLEAGGIDLWAWGMLTGRNPTGTTTQTWARGADEFPYFRIYGRSAGDTGGDVHGVIYRAKVTHLEGSMRQGEYLVTACAGIAVPDSAGKLYDFFQHATAVSL